MTKATGIQLDPQKEGNKIASYSVFCILEDENVGSGKRRIRFTLDENFVSKLPASQAAKNTAIGVEIKVRIKQEHEKWQGLDAANNAKVPPVTGQDLVTRLGFDEMDEADFA